MFIIRIRSKTEDTFRHVSVSEDGSSVTCDCGAGGGMCSHVDAVLIANERAMVHAEDHGVADAAYTVTAGKIVVPPTWRGAWRRNLWWRGITHERRAANPRTTGKPLVCFTGTLDGKPRKAWLEEAAANGWDTTDSPSRFTHVLVAADPTGTSAKLKIARQQNTPIVSAEEWMAVMVDGVLPD